MKGYTQSHIRSEETISDGEGGIEGNLMDLKHPIPKVRKETRYR